MPTNICDVGEASQSLWCNGHKYHIKDLDDNKKTLDYGINTTFEVINISHKGDRHPVTTNIRYYGYLEDILELDFNSSKVVLFKIRWYWVLLQGVERTNIDHDKIFTMTNITRHE
jgi:hypothetical protein